MDYSGNHFGPGDEVLDGNAYRRCTFDGTNLIYRGGDPPTITGSSFTNVNWIFDGPAANTIAFMHAMYHGMGQGGKKVIEDTFANIRKAPPRYKA